MTIINYGRKGSLVETYLYQVVRLRNSVNGNPRWKFITGDGALTIQSDAAVGGDVANRRDWVDGRVLFATTPALRVWDWVKLPEWTDRSAYVTDQVATWLANDAPVRLGADGRLRDLAISSFVKYVQAELWRSLEREAKHLAAWHVARELAPNDYDRIDWARVIAELKGD